jgi:hypothetical protein
MKIAIPDFWTIVLGIITVVSFSIAIYQTIVMEKTKKLNKKLEEANEELKRANEQKCSARCKEIAEIVEELAENMIVACDVVRKICVKKNQPCNYLVAKIDNSVKLTTRLIGFCNKLNEEHFEEFGHRIDIDMTNLLQYKGCLKLK